MTTTWAAVLTVGAVVALCNMQHSSANVVVPSKRIERVCGSIDVRNQVEHFSILENCTVIEGHLRIRLIEFSPEEDFNTLSFPDLREITDYVLLYRVYGLRSLAHMFPNLSVIRGQHLFFDYALVVFEMPDLEELGLQGMTRILRGAVRIEKNPQLCYIDTVDWSVLGVHKDDNFILQNKAVNECFNMCPKNEDGSDKCHLRTIAVDSDDDYTQASCWNADSCQKVCPLECGKQPCYKKQPNSSFECCHQECVGGCAGPKKSDCFACTNVFSDGSCESGCPRGTYKFRDRRCLTEAQCRELNFSKRNEVQQKWKLLDGQCALECPSGYMENASDPHRCEQCRGRCPKVCNSLTIDSVAAAQQAKGCTYVNGAIEIQIRGGNQISSELEENLGMIEVVQDYVKIVRSHALLSFHFLKNLRLIKGQRLYDIKYALYILDNQNLQDTWDLNKHNNLTIENGIMFFHFNRKLCLHKIHDLASLVKIREKITDSDVSPTNGDLVPCLISTVALDVFNVESTFALVRWSSFNTSDEREVLSWVIYYRETNDENVTIFDSRDACGSNDMWKTIDHKPDVDKSDRYTADILYHLKPFTKYALYVQTYTIMTAQRGARSAIQYFMTLPDTPSPARDVAVESKYPGELHVSWKPPANPNGNVTHYYIYWQPQPMPAHKFKQRDYCKDKLRLVTKPKASEEVDIIASNKTSVDGQCCSCPKSITQIQSEDEERRFQIEFENFLHDSVYRKHSRKTDDSDSAAGAGLLLRKRRSVLRYLRKNRSNSLHQERVSSNSGKVEKKRVKRFSDEDDELDMSRLGDRASKYSQLFNNVTFADNMTLIPPLPSVDENELEPYEAAIVYDKTEIILTNLKHFQEYSIEVIACHEFREERHNDRKLCSNRAITTARTLPNRSADLIDPKNVSIDVDYGKDSGRSSQVRIKWTDPPNPNGLVVLYDIEFSRVDVAFYKPETYCIPHSLFAVNGGYIAEKLAPGNWSFRIRVTSLAGNGSWTDHQYFIVDQMDTSATHFAVIISVVLVVIFLAGTAVVLGILYYIRKKQEEKMVPGGLYVLSANPHYADPENTYIADEWEVPRDKIKKIRELGKGSFGMVFEGLAEDLMEDQPKTKVAIKTVGEKASYRDIVLFLNEASVMKQFKAHHVVQLLGIVSKDRPPLVIMELMANGDLKNYLRMLRPDEEKSCSREPLTLRRTLQMAGEIADGMAYLAYKKFVHRDLAARNCMVSDDLTVKIGDFGMTRDIYEKEYYRNGARGLLPVRWMAPEALKDGTFSIETDVWSYGVVLWEMATLAAMPYQGLSNEEVLKFVTDGGRMQRPEDCPDRIFDLMDRCWQLRPSRRPSFIGILEELMEDLSETFREVSFYHNQDRFAGTVLDAETEDAVEYAGESVADDERIVGNTTSLLYGSQPEKEPLYPMDNSRLMPIMPVDKLTYYPGEGSAVADRFADCGVSETYSGVSERLLGGQGDAEVHQILANSHEPYTDAPKSVARSNRLTNGHIPYQNAQPSDGVLVRVGITNC